MLENLFLDDFGSFNGHNLDLKVPFLIISSLILQKLIYFLSIQQ